MSNAVSTKNKARIEKLFEPLQKRTKDHAIRTFQDKVKFILFNFYTYFPGSWSRANKDNPMYMLDISRVKKMVNDLDALLRKHSIDKNDIIVIASGYPMEERHLNIMIDIYFDMIDKGHSPADLSV